MESEPELKFRNTRSKFYKPKTDESSPDHPTKHTGEVYKGNHWK